MQAPCKFRASLCTCNAKALHENVQRFCVARANGGIREFHTECIELHENMQRNSVARFFVQLGCKNLQVSLSETCTHLVQATYVARDCPRPPQHKESLTHNQQKTTTTHSQYSAPDHGRCPPPSSPGEKTIKIYYKHDRDYREGRASSSRRLRRQGRASASMCCRHHRLTGGGSLRSEGLMPATGEETDASRGATVTAALATFSRLLKKGARAGAALTASYRRASMPHAGPRWRWRHGRSRGRRGCNCDGDGEENGGEGVLIPSLVGLQRCWTTRMRMTVAAGGTKQKPTP